MIMKCSLPISDCSITPCPMAIFGAQTMRSVNPQTTTIFIQPVETARDITELVARPQGMRGNLLLTACSSKAFVLDPGGKFTLYATHQPLIPASTRHLSVLSDTEMYPEARAVESMMLSGYFIVTNSRRNFFELDLRSKDEDPMRFGSYLGSYLRPPAFQTDQSSSPLIRLQPGTFRITDRDADVRMRLEAIGTVIPDIVRAAQILMPLKNASTILTVIFVDGAQPEMRVRLTSCLGNTWSSSFCVDAENKDKLMRVLS